MTVVKAQMGGCFILFNEGENSLLSRIAMWNNQDQSGYFERYWNLYEASDV